MKERGREGREGGRGGREGGREREEVKRVRKEDGGREEREEEGELELLEHSLQFTAQQCS